MKVLVIGNGFDLAHGFETKYRDFLDFVSQFNSIYELHDHGDLYRLRSGRHLQFFSKLFSQGYENSNEIIRELRKLTFDNIWVAHFWEVMDRRGENWIDFEKEISNVVQMQESYFDCVLDGESFETAAEELKGCIVFKNDILGKIEDEVGSDIDLLNKFKNACIDRYLDHLNNLTRALEIYFTLYIGSLQKPQLVQDILDIDLHENDAIISFNYTDTYSRLYKQNPVNNVYFLHGKAVLEHTVENNDMVLGIDEYNSDDARDSKLDYVAFKKYFQRIIKGTTPRYKEIFQPEDSKEPIDIYIYGHSLDVTDKDVLKEIITADKRDVNVTVFSYDKQTQKAHVRNLVQILGMDEMIEKTYNLDPKIKFKLQKV